MIQKTQTLTVLGRRTKQQILKEAIRPDPADTISSPPVSTGGGPEDCSGYPPGGELDSGCASFSECPAGAWDVTEFVTCERNWTLGGLYSLNGEVVYGGDDPAIDDSLVSNGSISGTPMIFPYQDASGDLENAMVFGAAFTTWVNRNARVISDCEPTTAERNSVITGIMSFAGDYTSDPEVDYLVFGISESLAYQSDFFIYPTNTGTYPQLRYYDSSRFVFGELATESSGDTIVPGWIFDEWVMVTQDATNDQLIFTPIGVKGADIPFSFMLRTRKEDGVRVRTVRIGDWVEETAPTFATDLDIWMKGDRTINWNLGTTGSLHLNHFHAAYKGGYPPLYVSINAIHTFFEDETASEPIDSQSRVVVSLKRISDTEYEFYQDMDDVYNVWTDGILVPPTSYTLNGRVITFSESQDLDTIVTAEVLVA